MTAALDSELGRLRDVGLGAFPPAALGDLAGECRASGENENVAWPFVVGEAIEDLDGCWTELDVESGQGVPTHVVDQLDAALRPALADLLASEPAVRLVAAQSLRASVRAVFEGLQA
jgi:hypothetical protein